MKAIRVHHLGDPSVLTLDAVEDLAPGEGEVLVRLHAIGVNPVEAYQRAGQQGYAPQTPYTPGSDGAGVVEAIGAEVSGISLGDRVYLSSAKTGTYAAFALCTPQQVHPLPEAVSFEQGAALGVPYATAYRALVDRAEARAGETVLIHGATGGAGIAALQLALAHGCEVFGTGGTGAGRKLLREQGAARVFDHHDASHFGQIEAATDGRGVDVIIEMLANVNLGRDLDVLAPGGRVVVVGSRGDVEITPRALMSRDADIRGMSLRNTSADDRRRIHAALGELLAAAQIRPVVGQTFALADAAAAHRALIEDAALGKIVLVP